MKSKEQLDIDVKRTQDLASKLVEFLCFSEKDTVSVVGALAIALGKMCAVAGILPHQVNGVIDENYVAVDDFFRALESRPAESTPVQVKTDIDKNKPN